MYSAVNKQIIPETTNSKQESLRFLHFSDTHLPEHEDAVAWDYAKPYTTLRSAMESATAEADVDFFLHTGDIAGVKGPGSTESYCKADRVFSELNMPSYYLSGNHDCPSKIRDNLSISSQTNALERRDILCYEFEKKSIHFMVLDSTVEKRSIGWIDSEQLSWLKERLESIPEAAKVIVALHHPLFSSEASWIRNRMLLQNAETLHSLLEQHKESLLCVLTGHIHTQSDQVIDGIRYLSAPAASYPFLNSDAVSSAFIDPKGTVGFNTVTVDLSDYSVKVQAPKLPKLECDSFVGYVANASV